MSVKALIHSVTTSLTHNLRLATSDQERHLYATQALLHAEKVLGDLDAMLAEKGDLCEEYRAGQEAALDLLTTAGIAFVRSCTTYSEGITLLESLALKTNDTVLRRKLRIYANQLKKRWNEAEPGGILHAPRAARRARIPGNGDSTLGTALVLVLIVLACGTFYFKKTQAAAPESAERQYLNSPPVADFSSEPVQPATPVPAPEVAPTTPVKNGDYCRYTDDSGVIHLVNDPANVPARYRSRMTVVASGAEGGGNATPVVCARNRVLVPVTLRYQGRETETVLLLDTGATMTTISESVASRLGINPRSLPVGRSIVADGRAIPTYHFSADLLSVGQKRLAGQMIAIMPGSGGDGAEGLLGMNFLKEFRYHVDFKRGVIEWDG